MPAHQSDIEAIALLDEPIRRDLYSSVIAADHAVSRDEAAAALGITRALAAFHLDRLADAGLLMTEFRRLTGRTGPGAGRPAKLYRRGPREVAISLPERRYDIPASLFASTIERLDSVPSAALRDAAHAAGEGAGAAAREAIGDRRTRRRMHAALLATLTERGYEPIAVGAGEIQLGNCPFHALVEDHRDLVCGMNLALTDGLLDGLGSDAEARLDPQPGRCCVVIGSAS